MRSFILDVLLDTAAPSSKRVTGVQDVEKDIGGVNDLVQLVLWRRFWLAFAQEKIER